MSEKKLSLLDKMNEDFGGKLKKWECERRAERRRKAVELCDATAANNKIVFSEDPYVYEKLGSVLLNNIMQIIDLSGRFNKDCPKKIKKDINNLAKKEVNCLAENMRIMSFGWVGVKILILFVFFGLVACSNWMSSEIMECVAYGWIISATIFLGFYRSCSADVWGTLLQISRENFRNGSEEINIDLYRERESEQIKEMFGVEKVKKLVTAL